MKKPRRASDSRGAGAFAGSGLRGHSTAIRRNWRDHLPDPATYYAAHVAKLGKPTADGWAGCRCPFHEDRNASAGANLRHGGFRCHGCNTHHDMTGFHMLLRGLDFTAAVRELIGANP